MYAAGSFVGPTAYFDGISLTNADASSSNQDAFVVKLTDEGYNTRFTWGQRMGGNINDRAVGLAVDGPNVYVAGWYYSASAGFGATTLTNAGSPLPDVFVTKLADIGPSSSFTWAVRGGSPTNSDQTFGLALAGSNIYVTGFTRAPSAFGSHSLSGPANNISFLAGLTDAVAISSFTPTSGYTNSTTVTISGDNLNGATGVRFNGTAATSYSVNAAGTQITVTLPLGATTGPISVTTPRGTATSSTNFTVTGVGPIITSFSPKYPL